MRSPSIGLAGFTLALLVLATPSFAQYMYLDSNGDGAHTAADELHAIGPTVVDVWLDTAHNRDGTATVCELEPATPLSMFSYVVNLQATGGTVGWSAFTNRLSQFGPLGTPPTPDPAQFGSGGFYNGQSAALPPGKYLLGTLVVNVTSGAPSLGVVTSVNLGTYSDPTSFGSYCPGNENPNTITFGLDWFDTDGLPFGSGGTANQSPVMSTPSNMTVVSGENAIQTVSATDPEGQLLTFAKVSGPAFMFVAPTDQGLGTAHAEIRLAPFASDAGTSAGSVSVSDGISSDQETFLVTVTSGPNHPPFMPSIPKLTVLAGRIEKRLLSAGDPDGGAVHIGKTSGPAFVRVQEVASAPGGALATLTASPGLQDVGPATVTLSVSDGVSEEQRQAQVAVLASSAPPDTVPISSSGPLFPLTVAVGDMNEDGILDVVMTPEARPLLTVLLGLGNGHLGPPVNYALPVPAGPVAIGDFNGDGHLDVAAGNVGGPGVSILLGVGNGTLLSPSVFGVGQGASGIVAGDWNHDGILDLAVSNRVSESVTVLMGNGDGTFKVRPDVLLGVPALSLVSGDFNRDGRPDIAVGGAFSTTVGGVIAVLPGLGDGSFGDPVRTPIHGYPFSLSSADWNWDGAIDVGFADLGGTTQTLLGQGDGTFVSPRTLLTTELPYTSAAADLNADGNTDLVVGDPERSVLAIFFGDGAGGFAAPVFRSSGVQSITIGDMNGDGQPDIVVADAYVTVYLSAYSSPASVDARAFQENGARTIPVGSAGATLCIRIEPIQGSYKNTDVDLASITLRSENTGSASEIHADPTKTMASGDADGNGVSEIVACFGQPGLATLFDHLKGRNTVTGQIAGSLAGGATFHASVALNIQAGGGPAKIAFAPNPLNPMSTLTITTTRQGPARAFIFDTQGRRVRVLLDTQGLTPGKHEYSFDGKSDRGSQLSSGLYFYRVESADGSTEGRIVILK